MSRCSFCNGSGVVGGRVSSFEFTCTSCDGRGYIKDKKVERSKCSVCHGSGSLGMDNHVCSVCGGDGYV